MAFFVVVLITLAHTIPHLPVETPAWGQHKKKVVITLAPASPLTTTCGAYVCSFKVIEGRACRVTASHLSYTYACFHDSMLKCTVVHPFTSKSPQPIRIAALLQQFLQKFVALLFLSLLSASLLTRDALFVVSSLPPLPHPHTPLASLASARVSLNEQHKKKKKIKTLQAVRKLSSSECPTYTHFRTYVIRVSYLTLAGTKRLLS